MADVEPTSPEGDASRPEEDTPTIERRSSIGDMVKDLENAYEEAQEEVALLSEQVKTMDQVRKLFCQVDSNRTTTNEAFTILRAL